MLLKTLTCYRVWVFFFLSHLVWDCNPGTGGWGFLRGDPGHSLHRRGCQVLQKETSREWPGAEVAGPRVAGPDCVVRAREPELLRLLWEMGPPSSAEKRTRIVALAGHLFFHIFSWKWNFVFIDLQYYRFYGSPLFLNLLLLFIVLYFFFKSVRSFYSS